MARCLALAMLQLWASSCIFEIISMTDHTGLLFRNGPHREHGEGSRSFCLTAAGAVCKLQIPVLQVQGGDGVPACRIDADEAKMTARKHMQKAKAAIQKLVITLEKKGHTRGDDFQYPEVWS